TFFEAEVREVFRTLASNLAAWVQAWPAGDLTPDKDLDGRLSEFARFAAVLVLAASAADVPDDFRNLVRQLTPLRQGEAWAQRLAETFAALQDVSDSEITAETAQQALEHLLHEIQAPDRESISGKLIEDLAALYTGAGQHSPAWLDVLQERFAPPPDRTAGDERPEGRTD
ncbi:hypothetical protein, partial [Longimicrobium sp.]|uniref:hypothetical protein n=1 Tax=Longimicrobium sp. TaxID=2029185 RepID=UPI002E3492A0